MWVDRYRPKRYLDLLGDDRIHREVMSWVKEWDYCVFGKNKGKKRARDEENLDEYHRPREKVSVTYFEWRVILDSLPWIVVADIRSPWIG